MKNKEIRLKKIIDETLAVIECPKCKKHAASAIEISMLPNWATCSNSECENYVVKKTLPSRFNR